ncbi:MAG: DUF4430 domain-containing protein [Patescibacteria group bacterium]
MKSLKFIFLSVCLVIISAGFLSGCSYGSVPVQTDEVASADQGYVSEAVSVSLVAENNAVLDEYGEFILPAGASAYDLMVVAQEKGEFVFTGKEYEGMGYFVETVNGVAGDVEANMFWIYYINNEKAQVGVSAYELKEGDVIKWSYEQGEF